MDFLGRADRMFKWLLGKSSEVKHLSRGDFLLAEVVLKIQRENLGAKFITVSLNAVKQIHSIDRESALHKLEERKKLFSPHKDKFVGGKAITNSFLESILPSVTPIKVIKMESEVYVAFEGNGRLVALRQIYGNEKNIIIEVELYDIENDLKIQKMVRKVMKLNKININD